MARVTGGRRRRQVTLPQFPKESVRVEKPAFANPFIRHDPSGDQPGSHLKREKGFNIENY